MRREFSSWIENFGRSETRFIFLTGDLGFGALENVQDALQERFINMGVCEQNMISVAAGLSQQGLLPLCYSIAPFAVFRPYEQIRLDVALHGLNVKIVGNGGGYGYGIMGASHHALEDVAALSALQHLRLGFGVWPSSVGELPAFAPIRKLVAGRLAQPKATVVGLGPVLLNTLPWILEEGKTDLFAVSQVPLMELSDELIASVDASGLLWVIEEHVARGGLGEHLAARLAQKGVRFRLCHTHALGYPDGLYGSQSYHQSRSGLDPVSLQSTFRQVAA
jgi:transketolase